MCDGLGLSGSQWSSVNLLKDSSPRYPGGVTSEERRRSGREEKVRRGGERERRRRAGLEER